MNRNLTKSTLAAALALAVFAMSPSPTYAAARPFPWWGAAPVLCAVCIGTPLFQEESHRAKPRQLP